MWAVPAVTFLVCSWTVAAAWFADEDRQERLFLAVVLFASFGASMVAWLFDSLAKLTVMDAVIFAYALRVAISRGKPWRAQFACLAGAQLALDFLYEAYGSGYIEAFAMAYDASFFGELAVVSGGGDVNVLVRLRRRRLPDRLRVLSARCSVLSQQGEVSHG